MILIIVPAYNEEKQIGRTVRGLFEHGYQNVLVVDDGSTDATAKAAGAAGAAVARHAVNRGQGAALETGDEYARRRQAEIAVHFDADGQFNPADIALAVEKIRCGAADVVLGSRFLDGRSRVPFFKRYLILPAARLINRIFSGVKLTDAHNGFRVLSSRALQEIRITHDGMAHNTEIVTQIKKRGLRLAETPVEVRYYEYGQGVGAGIKILKDLILGKIIK